MYNRNEPIHYVRIRLYTRIFRILIETIWFILKNNVIKIIYFVFIKNNLCIINFRHVYTYALAILIFKSTNIRFKRHYIASM